MKTGDLVRVTRASIGMPKGSLALVEAKLTPEALWQIYLLQTGRRLAMLSRDLEIVS